MKVCNEGKKNFKKNVEKNVSIHRQMLMIPKIFRILWLKIICKIIMDPMMKIVTLRLDKLNIHNNLELYIQPSSIAINVICGITFHNITDILVYKYKTTPNIPTVSHKEIFL